MRRDALGKGMGVERGQGMLLARLRQPWVWYLLGLATVVVLLHGPLFGSFFIEDDGRNLYVGSRVENWLALFYSREVSIEVNNYFYRPISYLSLWLDGRLFGLNPLGYHLHALALLLASGVLLAELIRRISWDSTWACLAGALLVLSPVATATTAWLAAAHLDLLGGCLYLGSLLSFAQHRQEGSRGWYLISVALAVASLFSKETMVTLPLALLIVDRTLGRSQREREWSLLPLLPFFAALAVYLALRTYMMEGLGGYPYLPFTPSSYLDRLWRLPLLLAKETGPLFPVAGPAAGLAAVVLIVYLLVRSPSRLLCYVGFFLLMLAPSVPVLGASVSGPRNIFMPMLAVAVALADALRTMLRSSWGRMRLSGILVGVLLAVSFFTSSWELVKVHVARSQRARRLTMAAWHTLQSAPPATKLFFVYDGSPWSLAGVLSLMSKDVPPRPFAVLRPAPYRASWGLAERLSAGERVRVYVYHEPTGEWKDWSGEALEDLRTHLASRRDPPPAFTAQAQEYRLSLRWEGPLKSQPVHLYVGKGDRGIYSEELPGYRESSISLLRGPGQYELAVAYQFDSGAESQMAVASVRIDPGRRGGHPRIPDHYM
jgi:hypothetical protein